VAESGSAIKITRSRGWKRIQVDYPLVDAARAKQICGGADDLGS
jgi:hypothetical protein